MAVALFTDRRMLDHRVPPRHPERPERLQAILRHLERTGYLATCPAGRPRGDRRRAGSSPFGRLLRRVAALEAEGGGMLDPDTWVFPGSDLAARLAAGAAIEAVSSVLAAADRRALCLVRPPGHHARPGHGHGLLHLRQRRPRRGRCARHFDVNRVLIVDFDVHHGNGTQEIFYESAASGSCRSIAIRSIREPARGTRPARAPGLGYTRNIPYPMAPRGPTITPRSERASRSSPTAFGPSSC